MRSRLVWLVVVLGAVVAGVVAWQGFVILRQLKTPSLADAGGTILVYEMDVDALPGGKPAADRECKLLAYALQRRLDPRGNRGIKVTAIGPTRVEISVPRVDNHAEHLQEIKALIRQTGRLEFRILANGRDDADANNDARTLLNPEDASAAPILAKAQADGLPPPGPHTDGLTGQPRRYTIHFTSDQQSTVTYGWVELGPHMLHELPMDNAARTDPTRNHYWLQLDRAHGQAVQLVSSNTPDHQPIYQGALFYRRECKDRNLSEQERRTKLYEYFVLARNPEIDPESGKETPAIDGSYVISASTQIGTDRSPGVAFALNAVGADLLGTLTRKNVPSIIGNVTLKRHLAILLDGVVMSAPTVNSEIRQFGQITGNFKREDVDRLVQILRAGALPARLKPQPVLMKEIAPAKGES